MQVIEQFTEGKKGDPALNEDAIVVTPDFIAVFDGVTSAPGETLQGKTTGRFAAEFFANAVKSLPAGIDAKTAIKTLSDAFNPAAEKAAKDEGKDFSKMRRPAAAMVLYSRAREEIWRIADPAFMVDGTAHEKELAVARNRGLIRQMRLHIEIAKGATEEELLKKDPTPDQIAPAMAGTVIFINNGSHPYGYAVLNGTPVPESLIEVFSAKGAREIVLASDGYPQILPTLQASEDYLKKVITEDPLMYKLTAGVKGVTPGQVSFDDRAYIRFKI
jgi:hypothetical protein